MRSGTARAPTELEAVGRTAMTVGVRTIAAIAEGSRLPGAPVTVDAPTARRADAPTARRADARTARRADAQVTKPARTETMATVVAAARRAAVHLTTDVMDETTAVMTGPGSIGAGAIRNVRGARMVIDRSRGLVNAGATTTVRSSATTTVRSSATTIGVRRIVVPAAVTTAVVSRLVARTAIDATAPAGMTAGRVRVGATTTADTTTADRAHAVLMTVGPATASTTAAVIAAGPLLAGRVITAVGMIGPEVGVPTIAAVPTTGLAAAVTTTGVVPMRERDARRVHPVTVVSGSIAQIVRLATATRGSAAPSVHPAVPGRGAMTDTIALTGRRRHRYPTVSSRRCSTARSFETSTRSDRKLTRLRYTS